MIKKLALLLVSGSTLLVGMQMNNAEVDAVTSVAHGGGAHASVHAATELDSRITNSYTEANAINASLEQARANLQNVPGVQSAIDAINKSIQENYVRGNQISQAKQAEVIFFQNVQREFEKLEAVVNNLQTPQPTQNQLRLDNPSDLNQNQPRKNVTPQQ